MFEPWQGPVFTTIRHRQKLGYMRNSPRHFFRTMPGHIFILATVMPRPRVYHTAGLVRMSNNTLLPSHLSKEKRRPSFWNFISVIQITTYISLSFRLFWFPRPSFILKPHVGIEPTSLAWKANILNRYTNGTNVKCLGLRHFYTFFLSCKNF